MEIEIKTIEDYINAIELIKKTENNTSLWFRGQNRSYYDLQPSLLRHSIQVANQFGELTDFETPNYYFGHGQTVLVPSITALLDRFKDYCNHNSVEVANPKNDLEWYFIAQHYGLPTTLLDWTEDPMIALFFAIHNSDPADSNVNVFLCSPNNLNHELTMGIIKQTFDEPIQVTNASLNFLLSYIDKDADCPYLPICIKPSLQNYRIVKQSGNFIMHGSNFQPLNLQPFGEKFHRIWIKNSNFKYFEKALSILQITEQVIYGNKTHIDDATKKIKEEVQVLFYKYVEDLGKNNQKKQTSILN